MLNSNQEVGIRFIVARDANEKLHELEPGDVKMPKVYSQYGEVNSVIVLMSMNKKNKDSELEAIAEVFDKIYEMAFLKGYERGVEDTKLQQMMEE